MQVEDAYDFESVISGALTLQKMKRKALLPLQACAQA